MLRLVSWLLYDDNELEIITSIGTVGSSEPAKLWHGFLSLDLAFSFWRFGG